ncbi:CDP-glycerol:glycerophosphate glycerophosphotransferase [Shewanella sp. OPT22]|nr:CDP-glycerol:glycerophosphate glycerophosphotransferase [Shewanella sp. OPT22]
MRYLFYVTLSYSYSVLRPLENEIKKRGDAVAWFIPQGSEAEAFLGKDDVRLHSVDKVKHYSPDAVIAPGNYIPDFFPGIKVQVFHGFDSGKKNKFNVRGFYDLYCTQGPNITEAFNQLQDGTFEVVETGWAKLDPLFQLHADTPLFQSEQPVILYAPTFSPKLTSTYELLPQIKALLEQENWHWIVKLHPKATTEEIEMFKALSCSKLTFVETGDVIPLLQAADVLLSDTSSILAEFALQNKPVVALNNRMPQDWMINISEPNDLGDSLKTALNAEPEQINKIENHCRAIHPYRDGLSSARVLNATEQLIGRGTEHFKSKPLNLIRRIKMRKKLGYFKWR